MSQIQRQLREKVGHIEEASGRLGVTASERLGLAAYARERAEEGSAVPARVVLEALVDLDPENPYFHTCLGALALCTKDWELAEAALTRATKLDDASSCARLHLSEMFAARGQIDRALTELHAISESADSDDRYVNRARKLTDWLRQEPPVAARAGGGY